MGRHSAPDDAPDDPDAAPEATAAVAVRDRDTDTSTDTETDTESRGRHSRRAGVDEGSESAVPATAAINGTAPSGTATNGTAAARPRPGMITAPAAPAESAAPEPAVVARPAPEMAPVPDVAPHSHPVLRGAAHNSAADLHLVRSNRGVLAMCVVAVVVPFVVEVVVLLVLGTLTGHSVLVWLWAPLVVAGVLLGVALDIAHRRHTAETPDPQPGPPDSGPPDSGSPEPGPPDSPGPSTPAAQLEISEI